MKAVNSNDEIMLITATGIIIRTGLDQLRSIGRNTQGVRLIKLREGDKLVAAAKIAIEPDEEEKKTTEAKSEKKTSSSKKASGKSSTSSKGKSKAKPKKKTKKRTKKKK
jgi:DNA gyrase subunit A